MHAAQNCTITEITQATGISKTILYRYVKNNPR
jgi:predicted DNA-binding transcriptional regulator AlpA